METFKQTCGIIVILAIHCSQASWTSPDSKQYHIQTDEGPERYFRYLTDNGQYRKEKRLQDGTVIGTDAWIDASGFLRQKDYIADEEGYRILKSKTVYVGKGQPIEDAMRRLKASSSSQANAIRTYQTTEKPHRQNYIPTTTPSWLYYDHPTSITPILPKSYQIKDGFTSRPTQFNVNEAPSLKLQPPFGDSGSTISVLPLDRNQFDPISTAYPTSTIRTPISFSEPYAINTELLPPVSKVTIDDNNLGFTDHISTTPSPIAIAPAKVLPISSNDLEQQPLYSRPNLRQQFVDRNQLGPKHGDYNPNFGSGYEPQFPEYDGISVTNNGFRYYLPRQYHEEEGSNSQHRLGSFGYIDPFGIRRVTYYNASPEQGFLHKKNNRYVGFNATPYDPRPL